MRGVAASATSVVRPFIAIVAATIAAGSAASFAALRSDDPAGSMRERYFSAMTYAEFTASDTARQVLWREVEQRVPSSPAVDVSSIDAARKRWRLLVVAENSCTDAANTVPYLAALADRSPFIDVRVLRKADATDLLVAHPLGERQATPLVLVYDADFTLRGVWIEHPASLRSMIAALGDTIDRDSVRARVRAWYREDAGRSALRELLGIMERGGPRSDSSSTKPPACGS